MELFGIPISIGEILSLGAVVLALIAAYHKLVNKLDSVSEKVEALEEQEAERTEATNRAMLVVKQDIESRLTPLESQVRAQESNYSALNATLNAIQNNLSSMSGRLDTLITNILSERKQ